jgi:hypothetical protein
MKTKSDLKGKIKTFLSALQISGLNIRFIRCDDAGRNITMKKDLEIKLFGIKFESSGSRSLQRNGKFERKFQTRNGRIRSMLNGSGLEDDLRHKIWAEFVMNVIYLTELPI